MTIILQRVTKAPSTPLTKNNPGSNPELYARFFDFDNKLHPKEGREVVRQLGGNVWLIEVTKATFWIGKLMTEGVPVKLIEMTEAPDPRESTGNYCTFLPEDVIDFVKIE